MACPSHVHLRAKFTKEPSADNPTNMAKEDKPIDVVVLLTEPDIHFFTLFMVRV
jgi:hypothetical protein